MAKKIEKCNYLNFTFTIFDKYDVWQLSFKNPENSKIIKRSTKLAATTNNLQTVKKEIIPSLVEYLTGKIQIIEESKEYTVNDFADDYFNLYKSRVREHVYSSNLKHYNNYIKPYFGHRLISSLKPMELEQWQNDLIQNKKPLTVQKYRSVLFSIFDEAIKNEILQTNPLSKVTAPKLIKKFLIEEERNDETNPFSEKELNILLNNSSGYLRNFILLMYSSGMRPGEIIALYWKDIDFDKKQINIYKTVVRGKLGPPKTDSSVRKIDILPTAERALELQYEYTKDNKFVFVNSSKEMFYSHDIINLHFRKLLKLSNIEIRKLYNLRHTFASQLVSSGEDIVWISKILGHKDVSITLKYYTKFIKEDEDIRLKKIAKIGANFGANIFNDN